MGVLLKGSFCHTSTSLTRSELKLPQPPYIYVSPCCVYKQGGVLSHTHRAKFCTTIALSLSLVSPQMRDAALHFKTSPAAHYLLKRVVL